MICMRWQRQNPNWYTNLVTVEESLDENGVRYVPEEVIEEDRISGMSEDMIQQEYYCDFTANAQGFYFLKQMEEALNQNRITRVPLETNIPVDTWWDIGVSDSTAIWFTQLVGKSVHVINFYQSNSVGLDHYAKYLQELPYVYGVHHFPTICRILSLEQEELVLRWQKTCLVHKIRCRPKSI